MDKNCTSELGLAASASAVVVIEGILGLDIELVSVSELGRYG